MCRYNVIMNQQFFYQFNDVLFAKTEPFIKVQVSSCFLNLRNFYKSISEGVRSECLK